MCMIPQVEYVEDLEEDESDIEDAAEWGGSYWGAPGSEGAGGRRGGDGDSESEEGDDDDDEGEIFCCCLHCFVAY